MQIYKKIWFIKKENHTYGKKLPDNKTVIINKFKEDIINKS